MLKGKDVRKVDTEHFIDVFNQMCYVIKEVFSNILAKKCNKGRKYLL